MISTVVNTPDKPISGRFWLSGQAFLLGSTLGFLLVGGLALLLTIYGSPALALVYIVSAMLCAAFYFAYGRVLRRFSLLRIGIISYLAVAGFLGLTWAGLALGQMNWPAFAAVVSFPLILLIGLALLGEQGNRQLSGQKERRSSLKGGLLLGLAGAGLLSSLLQSWLEPSFLLLGAAISAILLLLFFILSGPRSTRRILQPAVDIPPLGQVLLKRFILLLFLYQVSAAGVAQLLDYMAITAVAGRFADSAAFAAFLGLYSAVINLAALLVLLVIGRFLLGRFGLRFSLLGNPLLDILLLLALVGGGALLGLQAISFFWLVIGARLLDGALQVGLTGSAAAAAYQPLSAAESTAVRHALNGIGFPLAGGLAGLLLLILNTLGLGDLPLIGAATLLLAFLWLLVGGLLFSAYGRNLRQTIRRQALDPVQLTLEDSGSRLAVDRLLAGEHISEIRLALDTLQESGDPKVEQRIINLLDHPSEIVQLEALDRLEALAPQAALPAVEARLAQAQNPALQGAALRAMAAIQGAQAVPRIAPYLSRQEETIRLGAAVGLLRYGGESGAAAVDEQLAACQVSADPADRHFLARVIGQVEDENAAQPLQALLADQDMEVRRAALAAAGRVQDGQLLTLVVAGLDERGTRSAASDALVAYGEMILPLVEERLGRGGLISQNTLRLVRAFGQISSPKVSDLLSAHINHPSISLRDQVLAILGRKQYQADAQTLPLVYRSLTSDVQFGLRLLMGGRDIGAAPSHEPLHRALKEELQQVRKRIFWNLSFIHDHELIARAQSWLASNDQAKQKLAMELLDVTLSPPQRRLTFPILDPQLDDKQRLAQLKKQFNIPALRRDERLQDLSKNYDQAWIRACAIYAAAQTGSEWMLSTVESALRDIDPVVRETAAWGLLQMAPDRFKQKLDGLLADEDANVAQMAASLVSKQA